MTEWIVSSSVLILVVILLRKILKGEISLRLQYALWALVLVRLLVPVNLVSSGMSVMNLEFFRSAVQIEAEAQDFALPDPGISEPNPDLPLEEQETQYEANRAEWERERDEYKRAAGPVYIANQLLKLVWSGAAVVGTVFLASNLRFAIRLRRNRKRLKAENIILPVYMTDEVETPCLFGLFRPAIYVPPEVAENAAVLRYAIAHETTHFHHYDHLWAILRGVCLTVHWYNPLVWRAAFLSQQDAELACDEGTIHTLGENERTEYGRTLIAMTCEKRPALLHTSTTMTGSGRSLKERVTMLVKKPKTARYAVIAVVLVTLVAVVCTFTGAKREEMEQTGPEIRVDFEYTVPDAVLDYAMEYVQREKEMYIESGRNPSNGLCYQVTDGKITKLTPINIGEKALEENIYMYLLEYQFQVDHPEYVIQTGGFDMKDGWLVVSRHSQPYLIFHCDESGWRLIGCPSTYAIEDSYATPEMLGKYGNAYTAAAMEMYEDFLESTA